MSDVIQLPTARAEPVTQSARRGRLPSSISRLATVRARRAALADHSGRPVTTAADAQAKKRMLALLLRLADRAIDGKLQSIVLAADVADEPLHIYASGTVNYTQALAIASRIQHRLASILEDADRERYDAAE